MLSGEARRISDHGTRARIHVSGLSSGTRSTQSTIGKLELSPKGDAGT
jgi:hypothetical protein